jgi:hypothetical protein
MGRRVRRDGRHGVASQAPACDRPLAREIVLSLEAEGETSRKIGAAGVRLDLGAAIVDCREVGDDIRWRDARRQLVAPDIVRSPAQEGFDHVSHPGAPTAEISHVALYQLGQGAFRGGSRLAWHLTGADARLVVRLEDPASLAEAMDG